MSLMDEIVHTRDQQARDSAFPHAPAGWNRDVALHAAQNESVTLGADHWEAVRALQEYYARHEDTAINPRKLRDALDEKFHRQGGMRYLYQLFPAGPIAQGCRIAGLKMPAGAVDKGFGSVM